MGLTQGDLAEGTGLGLSTIVSYEKGRTQPKGFNTLRLEWYLGVSKEWLCGEKEQWQED